ncbi:MAG: hypothetical protein JNM27_16895 [Leptospirales bacterium]|nr:hypothetical protein [Leptospirales bacterium]
MNRSLAFSPRITNSGYEIWFGTAFDFDQEVAVWFRYSTLIRPGRTPRSAIWFSFIDQKFPERVVRTIGLNEHMESKGDQQILGGSGFSQNAVSGTLDDVSWNLQCQHRFEAESHVKESLMNLPIIKTKSVVISPFCGFTGEVRMGSREFRLNATGCYTHIWGTQRVPELYWCFVPRFDDADVGLEFFAVRPKPLLPIIKFITIRDGNTLLHQPSLWKSVNSKLNPKFPGFSASGAMSDGRFELNCSLAEPATRYIYLDPSGSLRFIEQNDASQARLVLRKDNHVREFNSAHKAAVEFHGMQPWGEYEYRNPYEQ